VVEHLHHHATVGYFYSGTVPAHGESMWKFVIRNILYSTSNAYCVAEKIRKDRGHPWWRNCVIRQHCLSVVIAILMWSMWGWRGVGLFVVQAAIAIFTVELVQYFQHYGLVRENGTPVSELHSWNGDGWLTNVITLNIARHSEHHLDSRIPYQALRALEDAPYMPVGYFGLTWIALMPAVWRIVIDPFYERCFVFRGGGSKGE
jgi:alkane 1-monooxygenase